MKEARPILEPLAEGAHDFCPHFIATSPNRWPGRRQERRRLRTESEAHLAHHILEDPFKRPTPPHVNGGDSTVQRIHQQDRQTVGCPHRKQNGRLISDEAVSDWGRRPVTPTRGRTKVSINNLPRCPSTHSANAGRMNLPEFRQQKLPNSKGLEKEPPVLRNAPAFL